MGWYRVGFVSLSLVLLVPSAQAAEFDAVQGFLATADGPDVMGDHCRRHGGGRLDGRDQVGGAAYYDWQGSNTILGRHRAWHDDMNRNHTAPYFMRDDHPYGDQFRNYHRDMLAAYDGWRAANGFGPTPVWDPATPVPVEFQYPSHIPTEVSDVIVRIPLSSFVCLSHHSNDPKVETPSWATTVGGEEKDPLFDYTSLCQFPSINRIAKSIDAPHVASFHSRVHNGVSGDMGPIPNAPRDPLFWPWHNYLEIEIFQKWENECQDTAAPQEVATVKNAVPGIGAPSLFAVVVGACLIVAWRRRA